MKKTILLSGLCTLFLLGCGSSTYDRPRVIAVRSPSNTVTIQRAVAGRSIENRLIEYTSLGDGDDVIFIMATIHGNETAGTPLLQQLAAYLHDHPQILRGHKVILLPVANPDGVAHRRRTNACGVDLNRNFPASNHRPGDRFGATPLSEPESCLIDRLIKKYHPDRIVSLHQPLACIDYDGPARDLAYRMADHCRLPIRKLGARNGSLGAYVGESLYIPIVTLELRRDDHRLSPAVLWQQYSKALLTAVVYPESLDETDL